MSVPPSYLAERAIWPRLLMLGREPGTKVSRRATAAICTGLAGAPPFRISVSEPPVSIRYAAWLPSSRVAWKANCPREFAALTATNGGVFSWFGGYWYWIVCSFPPPGIVSPGAAIGSALPFSTRYRPNRLLLFGSV